MLAEYSECEVTQGALTIWAQLGWMKPETQTHCLSTFNLELCSWVIVVESTATNVM